jgi:peptide/nickel transport system permease protein
VIRWVAGRLLQGLLTVALATVLAFILMRLAPGDPLAVLGDDRPLTAEARARLEARYGLDRPVGAQFGAWVAGLARGDLGVSIATGQPVTRVMLDRLPASLLLGGTVLLLTFGFGIPLGVLQARHPGSLVDRFLGGLSLTAWAVPTFWLGLVLAGAFAVRWRLLPAAGMTDPLLDPAAPWPVRAGDVLRHLVLPTVTLTVVSIAAVMRYQRAAMRLALGQPSVLAARARGLPERAVVWRHAWRNALGPVIALFGLWLPLLVTGAVFVEYVFDWPGLGQLAAMAVSARDYPVVMGVTLLVAATTVTGNVVADLLHAAADPRVRA